MIFLLKLRLIFRILLPITSSTFSRFIRVHLNHSPCDIQPVLFSPHSCTWCGTFIFLVSNLKVKHQLPWQEIKCSGVLSVGISVYINPLSSPGHVPQQMFSSYSCGTTPAETSLSEEQAEVTQFNYH